MSEWVRDMKPISRNYPDWTEQATDESGYVTAAAPTWRERAASGEPPINPKYPFCAPEDDYKVPGVGPEVPVVVNDKGAKHSSSPYRCDLLPGAAILHLSHIFKYGSDKYGDDNWRGLTMKDHINHAMVHVFAYLAGDKQDDHLGHAAWRMLAALETKLTGGDNASKS